MLHKFPPSGLVGTHIAQRPVTVLLTQFEVLAGRQLRNLKRDWSLVVSPQPIPSPRLLADLIVQIMHNVVAVIASLNPSQFIAQRSSFADTLKPSGRPLHRRALLQGRLDHRRLSRKDRVSLLPRIPPFLCLPISPFQLCQDQASVPSRACERLLLAPGLLPLRGGVRHLSSPYRSHYHRFLHHLVRPHIAHASSSFESLTHIP